MLQIDLQLWLLGFGELLFQRLIFLNIGRLFLTVIKLKGYGFWTNCFKFLKA